MVVESENIDIIKDITSCKKELIDCIDRHGSVREHNYWFFCNQQTNYSKTSFFKFADGGMVVIRYDSGTWEVIGDILAPTERKQQIFRSFLNYVLSIKKDKKIFAFVPENLWNDIRRITQDSDIYRITNNPALYYTPIFDMSKWDETLSGKEWKKLRNIRNQFMKSNNVEIVPSKDLGKNELISVIHAWRRNRPNKIEKTYYTRMYINFVNNDFEGVDMARSVVVNGKPCTITAGWRIPNSNNYYSAIGLYNYKYRGLAEIANIDDLTQIKKRGYRYADFGDSTESLLHFKKKFNPDRIYKTYWFYIVKK